MKKNYVRPELLCEEYAPDTMIASLGDDTETPRYEIPGAKNGKMDANCDMANAFPGSYTNGNSGHVCTYAG